MGYVSPKTSSVSSFRSPKSSAYSSSKVSQGRSISDGILGMPTTTSKNAFTDFRELLTSYLELSEQIEIATASLEQLQSKKRALEAKIASAPEYGKFATLFNSMKGPIK